VKIITDIEQGTPEWLMLRLGKPTASHMSDILAKPGSATRTKYLYRLAGERIAGAPEPSYTNGYMQAGQAAEPLVRDWYSRTIEPVSTVTFVDCDTWGASPDGIVGDNGGIEIKTRIASVQVETLLDAAVPSGNLPQIHACMLALDRSWWDYVSYSPGFKPYVIRVERDKEWDKKINEALAKFCAELDAITTSLQNQKGEINVQSESSNF
jgi:hypothetical protein